MKTNLPVLFFLLFSLVGYSQNCTLSIDLEPEIVLVVLCQGNVASVNPIISENYESAQWSPTTGVANPTSPTTDITITGDQTYTLSVQSISPQELIFNGDFESGDTGFTSDYVYGTGGGVGLLSNAGEYAIVDDAGDTHNQFAHCSDHTTGNGNMMVVNASGDLSDLWCQDITVTANTDYQFSAWVASVVSENPAQLQFSINGTLIGNVFNATSATCNWEEFFAEWNSGTVTTAEICIVNSNLTPAGNDFALDDISFRQVCNATAEVDISLANLVNQISTPDDICQGQPSVPLDNFLNGSTPDGQWNIDGTTVTEIVPQDWPAGPHILSYTVSAGTCDLIESVIFDIIQAPDAGTGDNISFCQNDFININLNDLLQNADTGGLWERATGTPNNGNLFASGMFSGANIPAVSYDFWYIIPATSGCPGDTATVTLVLDAGPPVTLTSGVVLDCTQPTATIGNTTPGPEPNYTYTWFLNGVPMLDNDVPSIFVNEAGLYALEIFSPTSGCSAQAESTVTSLVSDLNFTLEVVPAECENSNSGQLILSDFVGGIEPYAASLNGQDFVPISTFANLEPGDYEVTVQDATGCEQTQQASLPNPVIPQVNITSSAEGLVPLGGSVTLNISTFPDISNLDTLYWQPAPPGCDGCTQVSFKPLASEIYEVVAIDDNGCIGTATVAVQVSPLGNIFIPNAISPNADGINDHFIIYDDGGIEAIEEVRIFDRWGALVYLGTDLAPNSTTEMWEGKVNGKAAASNVYIYSARIKWISGETQTISGEIHLVY